MSVIVPITFNPGDVVYLKSGSSRMTVVAELNGLVSVLWSDYNHKEIKRDTLPVTALVKKTF